MKIKIFYVFLLFLINIFFTSCSTQQYGGSLYQKKNMNKFSIAKNKGLKRHFLKKPKQKLNPSHTKHARDWYGE